MTEQNKAVAGEDPERVLIRSILAGDRESFRTLVIAHQERVFAMIQRQVGDRETASELAQEVFIRAYLGLKRFRGDSTFATWVTQIALNVANSYFASRRYRDRARITSLEALPPHSVPHTDLDETYSEEALSQLQRCIGLLKPIYRDVVVLCALERKSYEEAAEILGLPTGTISSRMSKAFKLLRTSYWQD